MIKMKSIDKLLDRITKEDDRIDVIERGNAKIVSAEGRDLILQIDPNKKTAELHGLRSDPKNPESLIRKTYVSYPGMLQLCTYLSNNNYEFK